jgi:hypothetical protein
LTERERRRLLSAKHRRLVLEIVDEERPQLPLADLAFEVARRDGGLEPEDTETLTRVKATLYHTHLPKMDDFEVLSYEPESNRIRV